MNKASENYVVESDFPDIGVGGLVQERSKRVQDVELGSKAQTGNQPIRDFLR